MLKRIGIGFLFAALTVATAFGAPGGLNPRDNAHSTSTRPAETNTGAATRKWFSDASRTAIYAQDLNRMMAQLRSLWDFYGITDTEGDDTLTRQSVQAAITGLQPLDSDLTAFAGLSTTGIVARTGAGAVTTRTITGPAAGLTITNGNGVAGNPDIALANDLAALEALASTGFAARTGVDTWAQRSLVAPAEGLTITNNAGIAGNPTFALANDLAALEALTCTNSCFPKRTGVDTWGTATIGTDLQAWDTDLDAVAGLTTVGFIARKSAGVAVTRTLTAPAEGFTITNNNGSAGNPTFVLANDLAALEALTCTNSCIPRRTGVDTWGTFTIGTDIQAWDADLDALAALATTGVAHRTGAGTWTSAPVSLTADVSGILPAANGGNGNGFFAVAGPALTTKTFTFPNANATVLTDAAAVTVAQGGTGSGTAAGARTNLGLVIGTDVEAHDADLTAIAALSGTGIPHDAAGTWSLSAINLATADVTGILPSTNGGAGTITGALKGNGAGVVSQAACGDLSNAAASCSTDTTNATNITTGTLSGARVALGAGLQTDGSNNVEVTAGHIATLNALSNTTLTNADCGTAIKLSDSGSSTVTFPATPPTGCTFTLKSQSQEARIDLNGKTAFLPGFGTHVVSYFVAHAPDSISGNRNSFMTLQFNGSTWEVADHSLIQLCALTPLTCPTLTHGQVVLAYDSGNTRFTLCPKGGPGGIIVHRQMEEVPDNCLYMPNTGTTSSALNYIYVYMAGAASITDAQNNGSGLIRLTTTFAGSYAAGSQVFMICDSILGVVKANGWYVGTVVDATHIDEQGTSFAGTWTLGTNAPVCRILGLVANTTGHTRSYGVESMTGDDNYTLVGMAYVGASNAVNDIATKRDVASWFNRVRKTCKSNLTADRTVAFNAAFQEVNAEIECEFVTWGENDLSYHASGAFSTGTVTNMYLAAAGFDSTSTAEAEQEGVASSATGIRMPLAINAEKTGLTEGKHFITLLGRQVTAGTITFYGTTPVTYLEISVLQ